jgi:aromatic ring-cleaving dioxygenase
MTGSASPAPVDGCHAHVHHDAQTRPVAEQAREGLAEAFPGEFFRFAIHPPTDDAFDAL